MEIAAPYLMFLGDVPDDLAAKTAHGIVDWRPEWCLGQLRLPGCRADLKIPDLTVPEAAERGARTMVVGVVIATGLHVRLGDTPAVRDAARKHGRRLFDVRHSSQRFATGKGTKRSGLRLLTVGTDCSVGKKYTALALEREMRARGFDADFRATGQTGVFISGRGVAIDAVVADFISGAVEWLSPEAADTHWDLVEGQGSLFHPSFAGVSLGLLHGAQPDAFVVCHEPTRTNMRGVKHPLPAIADVIDLTIRCGRLTNPAIRAVGIAVNTQALGEGEAQGYLDTLAADYKLPAVDPVRFGVGEIVDRVAHEFPQAAPQDGRLARASA
jgi:uncharacterized NAD-dependent epimerase/dehydratase family protein